MAALDGIPDQILCIWIVDLSELGVAKPTNLLTKKRRLRASFLFRPKNASFGFYALVSVFIFGGVSIEEALTQQRFRTRYST